MVIKINSIMKESIEITLPQGKCEFTTVEKLQKVKGIYRANVVKDRVIIVWFNNMRLTPEKIAIEIFGKQKVKSLPKTNKAA